MPDLSLRERIELLLAEPFDRLEVEYVPGVVDVVEVVEASALRAALDATAGDVEFTDDELTMLHRAVRQKLSRTRNDMARDRRRGVMHFARQKAAARYDYALLLLRLDALVPEGRR